MNCTKSVLNYVRHWEMMQLVVDRIYLHLRMGARSNSPAKSSPLPCPKWTWSLRHESWKRRAVGKVLEVRGRPHPLFRPRLCMRPTKQLALWFQLKQMSRHQAIRHQSSWQVILGDDPERQQASDQRYVHLLSLNNYFNNALIEGALLFQIKVLKYLLGRL